MTEVTNKYLDEIIETAKRIGRIDLETRSHGYFDNIKKVYVTCECDLCHDERKLEELLDQQRKEFEISLTLES